RIGETEMKFLAEEVSDAATLGGDALKAALVASAGLRQARSGTTPKAQGPLADPVGGRLDRYDVREVLFHGRSSVVFRARDPEADRDVALKVFLRDWGAAEMERFRRALEPVLRLQHPHLVAMYDVGRTGQHCWVATQYVERESLTQVIQRIG